MSAPSYVKAFKNGVEVSTSYHNWGWISPSSYEIAIRIIEIVSDNHIDCQNKFPKDWDYLIERAFGKLTRENYELMYDEAKKVHDKEVEMQDFDVYKYFN